MKRLVEDWKFYDVDGDLKLYVVSKDERGIEVGKMYDIPESQIDPSDLNLVPDGGTTGQALKKYDDNDGGYSWQDTREVPTSGTQGQVITKGQDDNYGWEDLPTDNYSTTEVKTNKKYNNKDVYRKVVTIDSTDLLTDWHAMNIVTDGTVDDILEAFSIVKRSDNTWFTEGYQYSASDYMYKTVFRNANNGVDVYLRYSWPTGKDPSELRVVVEYTKITV